MGTGSFMPSGSQQLHVLPLVDTHALRTEPATVKQEAEEEKQKLPEPQFLDTGRTTWLWGQTYPVVAANGECFAKRWDTTTASYAYERVLLQPTPPLPCSKFWGAAVAINAVDHDSAGFNCLVLRVATSAGPEKIVTIYAQCMTSLLFCDILLGKCMSDKPVRFVILRGARGNRSGRMFFKPMTLRHRL